MTETKDDCRQRTTPTPPTMRVATHGDPRRELTLLIHLLTGSGHALSRPLAQMTREYCRVSARAALTMATMAPMVRNVTKPSPKDDRATSVIGVADATKDARFAAPNSTATNGTTMNTMPIAAE